MDDYYWPFCRNCAKVCRDYPKLVCDHALCTPCANKVRREYDGRSTFSCPVCFRDTVSNPASTSQMVDSFVQLLDDVKSRALFLTDIEKDRESFVKELDCDLADKLHEINLQFDRIGDNLRALEASSEALRLKIVTTTMRNAELIALELGKRVCVSEREQLVRRREQIIADEMRFLREGKFANLRMRMDALQRTEDKIKKAVYYSPMAPKYKNLVEKPHKINVQVLATLSSNLLDVFEQHLPTNDEECGSLVLLCPVNTVPPLLNTDYGLTTCYNLRLNRWFLLQSTVMGQRRWFKENHAVIAVHKGQVCVAYSQSEDRRALDVYDPEGSVWRQLPDMPTYRHSHVLISLNGMLYALGGIKGPTVLNKVEAYQDTSCSWTVLTPMHQPRRSFECATLSNSIVAIGGRREDGTAYDECEMYDVRSKQWCPIAALNHSRIRPVAVTFQHRIYVFGGTTSEKKPVQSIEQFDRLNAKWTKLQVKSMIGRVWSAAAAFNRIYLVGSGCHKGEEFHNVECFYPGMKTLLSNCMRQPPILDALPRKMVYVPVELRESTNFY